MENFIKVIQKEIFKRGGIDVGCIPVSYFVKLAFRHVSKDIYNKIGFEIFSKHPKTAFKQLGVEVFDEKMSIAICKYLDENHGGWDDAN